LYKTKYLKKKKKTSHKLPKHQSTNFWSQGILGIKRYHYWLKSHMAS
jgi:hypothetical protein